MNVMKNRVLLVFIILLSLVRPAYTQVGVSLYTDFHPQGYILSVNTSKSKPFSAELKSIINKGFDFELDGFYNIKRNSSYQVSIGLGLGIDDGKVQWNDYYYDYLKTVILPIQLELFPFKNAKKVSFTLEIAPYTFLEEEMFYHPSIRHLLGVKYSF
jgi:hypothetical protein